MAWTKTYFNLSSGLTDMIRVPEGTCVAIKTRFEEVTSKLKLEITQYKDNPPHWTRNTPPASVSNCIASTVVFEHNRFVRALYDDLAKWSQVPPDKDCENLTPEFAESIWYGFSTLHLNYDRWIGDVYTKEMEMLFDVMQGKEKTGISFGEAPLTSRQAADVINLFSIYFDKDDVRLTMPNDCDWLVTVDEYLWCPSHGAWLWSDIEEDEDEDLICPTDGCNEVIGQ